MSGAPQLQAELSPLAAVLERSLPASARRPEGFPAELWERALLGPLREFLNRPGKAFRARLVELGYALGDGASGSMPEELPLVLELLHAGSLIVDDIEDGSELRRGAPALHAQVGAPLALNAGNWLYFFPFELLSQIPLAAEQRLSAHDHMHACLTRCHEGQALDLQVRVCELEQAQVPAVVATVTRLKTGSLVGLAMALGAIAAGASAQRTHALHHLGIELGTALQMLDDLSGVVNASRRHKGAEDLQAQSPTWVWAWLAQDLDAVSYREHLAAARGLTCDSDASGLIERLNFRLGVTGRSRARQQMERALDTYVESQGEHAELADLQATLKRLERGYVEC